MSFSLPDLPYAKDALEPHISKETLEYHHGKHHQKYVDTLNDLIKDTKYANMSLEEIIQSSEGGIFNNAAQVFNHTFYWHCLSPNGGGKPSGKLLQALEKDFGSFDAFKEAFTKKALGQFGSGWAWLMQTSDGTLVVDNALNANNPLTDDGKTPLLTCDVWEHAYYIDYRNKRPEYLDAFWSLVNWEFVSQNLK